MVVVVVVVEVVGVVVDDGWSSDDDGDHTPQPPRCPPNTSLCVILSSLSFPRNDVAMNEPMVDGGSGAWLKLSWGSDLWV